MPLRNRTAASTTRITAATVLAWSTSQSRAALSLRTVESRAINDDEQKRACDHVDDRDPGLRRGCGRRGHVPDHKRGDDPDGQHHAQRAEVEPKPVRSGRSPSTSAGTEKESVVSESMAASETSSSGVAPAHSATG
jgi:hypothetical protein